MNTGEVDRRPESLRGQTTVRLLKQVRGGDREAREVLCDRFMPPLQIWARGQLPIWARRRFDTDDLVQETMLRTLRRLDDFEQHGQGGLLAYLRQILRNLIRDEIRRLRRRPIPVDTTRDFESGDPSPIEEALGRENLHRFETALGGLSRGDREAIIARIELGLGYREIAEHLGKPSPDAARMVVSRALLRLAKAMGGNG